MSAPAITDQWAYKGWDVSADYSCPSPHHVWCATSPDFDADCDQDGFFICSGGQVYAPTYEALIAEIDGYILENEA